MSFIKALFSFLGPGGSGADQPLLFYIKCSKCGSSIKLRIHKNHDLMPTYNDGNPFYILNKEAMDSKCFTMIHCTVEFDRDKNILAQEITGGAFMSEEEYAASP